MEQQNSSKSLPGLPRAASQAKISRRFIDAVRHSFKYDEFEGMAEPAAEDEGSPVPVRRRPLPKHFSDPIGSGKGPPVSGAEESAVFSSKPQGRTISLRSIGEEERAKSTAGREHKGSSRRKHDEGRPVSEPVEFENADGRGRRETAPANLFRESEEMQRESSLKESRRAAKQWRRLVGSADNEAKGSDAVSKLQADGAFKLPVLVQVRKAEDDQAQRRAGGNDSFVLEDVLRPIASDAEHDITHAEAVDLEDLVRKNVVDSQRRKQSTLLNIQSKSGREQRPVSKVPRLQLSNGKLRNGMIGEGVDGNYQQLNGGWVGWGEVDAAHAKQVKEVKERAGSPEFFREVRKVGYLTTLTKPAPFQAFFSCFHPAVHSVICIKLVHAPRFYSQTLHQILKPARIANRSE
jgi:hypothetical protein